MDSDSEHSDLIVGVSLVTEVHVNNSNHDIHIGIVKLNKNLNVADIRKILFSKIITLPSSFVFLTRESWPIQKNDEETVKLQNILSKANTIRIQKHYDKPRIGIQIANGRKLGFVFAELLSTVSVLRQTVSSELGNHDWNPYQFLDRNGWPITFQQERYLTVLDLLNDSCVSIRPEISQLTIPSTSLDDMHNTSIISSGKKPCQPIRQLTFQTSKDLGRRISSEYPESATDNKQILISYVRAESAKHAVRLKQELVELGLSVFLDVDEIKTGVDWQDALNYAVSTCEVFVPLVTSRYGETQWTNREVKLADVLEKFILPVSFLDGWPPRALAIQFATTQFIPWKPEKIIQEELDNFDHMHTVWDNRYIEQVATDIKERILDHLSNEEQQQQIGIQKKGVALKSYGSILPSGCSQSQRSLISQDREGKPLIVLCAHPKQKSCAEDLRYLLEDENYEVWCTHQLENSLSDDEESQKSDEGLTFSQASLISHSTITDVSSVEMENRLKFQEKADEAGLVIFILSKDFAKSKTSKQQVFYCEQRKKVIPVLYEEFCIPWWMNMLIGSNTFEKFNNCGFNTSLKQRIKLVLDPSSKPPCTEEQETRLYNTVKKLKDALGGARTVFIAGSTQFYDKATQQICKSVGKHLAGIDDIHLVTAGFSGVQDTVAKSYKQGCSDRHRMANIWHAVSNQRRQSYEPQGIPLPIPDGTHSWNTVVSKVFDICVLLEGGPGAAREVERFIWNDGGIVIPIKVTGGAAGGKFNVPDEIFKIPVGISLEDWHILSNKSSTPEEIGLSVSRIVTSLTTLSTSTKTDPLTTSLPISSISAKRSPGSSGSLKSPRRRRTAPQRSNTFVFKRQKTEFTQSSLS